MKKVFIVLGIIIFLPLLYQVIWLGILINLIESPLPESEEKVPDMGIVDE